MADASHFAPRPAVIVDAIITALSASYKKPTGEVMTVSRLAGNPGDIKYIDSILSSGSPAILILYAGGPFKTRDTRKRRFEHLRKIICYVVASNMRSYTDRWTEDVNSIPGIEDLLDWVTYDVCQTLLANGSLRDIKPDSHNLVLHDTGKFVYSVPVSFKSDIDVFDDTFSTTLDTIGLVKTPIDYDDLWKVDNETPKSEEPATIAGGVYDL